MAEENIVRIVEWPKEPAKLEHTVRQDKPCQVAIIFEKEPVNMNMQMHVSAREPVPLCIKLCEPICADSEYTIGIDIFDRPVAAITVRGRTRLFACDEKVS